MSAQGAKAIARSSPQLYRDCLRLVNHIAGKSKKGNQLRKIVKTEFLKNAKVDDSAKIETLKSNAIRGLANYLMIESTNKDQRLQQFANDYAKKEASGLQHKPSDSTSGAM